MEQGLQKFSFENKQVRIVMKDGNPWWVAKDVCDVLGIANPSDAIKPLDDDEKNTLGISEGIRGRGNPNMAVINESGVYALIMRSNKPEAKKFRKWITSEVLPAIRKSGFYATPQRLAELEAELASTRAKVLFADAYAASDSVIDLGGCAKLIRQGGVMMGKNRFLNWLRANGYLLNTRSSRFEPSQLAMELGLFTIQAFAAVRPNGRPKVSRKTMVTAKGAVYFVNKFFGNPHKSIAARANSAQLMLPNFGLAI
jgi:anti-repressor protein